MEVGSVVCKAGSCLFVLCCYGDDAALPAEVMGALQDASTLASGRQLQLLTRGRLAGMRQGAYNFHE